MQMEAGPVPPSIIKLGLFSLEGESLEPDERDLLRLGRAQAKLDVISAVGMSTWALRAMLLD